MTFKEKLETVDPATLVVGAELDILIEEILGGTISMSPLAPRDGPFVPYVYEANGKCHAPRKFSTSPGLAFEVLWPWLLDTLHDTAISIYQNPGQGPRLRMSVRLFPDGWIVSAKDSAFALCTAVVAVEKARSR